MDEVGGSSPLSTTKNNEQNKQNISKKRVKRYQENKEKYKKDSKKWRDENPEKQKEYRKNNAEKIKQYVKNNKDKINNYKKKIINFNPDVLIHLAWDKIPNFNKTNSKKNCRINEWKTSKGWCGSLDRNFN